MKIIVCVKQVLDTAAQIQINNGGIVSSGSSRIINPYDEFAIEEAEKEDVHEYTKGKAMNIGEEV